MKTSRFLAATAMSGLILVLPLTAGAQTTAPVGPATPGASTQTGSDTNATTAGSTTSPEAAALEQSPAQGASNDGGAEVVVTGTRIRTRSGTLDEAVPITTITAAELLGSRGDVSLGDALNQLPQLRSTFSQANSTATIGTAGLNLLDLRGLGTARTLTLVNGRRVVTAVPGSYTPDVNTIPSDLVERVDLVTGGNSAIYGSDAVAGVVNFVLKRNFDGFRIKGQGGVTTYGDRGNYSLSALAGHNFDDGKINITADVQYTKANPLYYADRPYRGSIVGVPGFITSEITTAPNRNNDGIPNVRFVPSGITFGSISTGSYVLSSCPAATATNAAQRAIVCTGQLTPTGGRIPYNFAFLPDGTLVRDDQSQGLYDNRPLGGGVLGGLSATGVEGAQLEPGNENINGTLLMHADLSSAFRPFAEASYAHVNALQQSVQPTFISSTLNPVVSINNPFLSAQARSLLVSALNPGATTFNIQRFNNDIGTRAENHKRDTYRAVVGVEGDISHTGNLHYEAAFNYGRTENFYVAGGNVLVANYNKATNAALAPAGYAGTNFVTNAAGQKVVCAVNADAITTNDDAACYPLNIFGNGAGDPRAVNYVLFPSTRKQTAQELDGTAYLTGDSTGLFRLPGGPVAFVVGGEYRQERATSVLDATTAAGLTFLNGAAPFTPPGVNIKEGFGELRVPLIANFPLIHELTLQGAGRVSDYGGKTGSVVAWDAGVNYAPFPDFHVRATLSRSVRAPNLSNLYATSAVTYANGLTDPCDQPGGTNQANNITAGPNRAKNCAAAGVPTTLNYTDSSGNPVSIAFNNVSASGVAGSNQGNQSLIPEVGYDFTIGGTFTPHYVPGLSFGATYYNIRVKNQIASLSGQQVINRCYDDPGGINNPFCAVVFRRSGTGSTLADYTFNGQTSRVVQNIPNVTLPLVGNGLGFISQPFNFASLTTRGIDIEAAYHQKIDDFAINYHLTVAYVMDRLSYSYITDPTRYDRIDSTLGDPKWQGSLNIQMKFRSLDLTYNERYVGKQIVSGLSYETFFASQGRPALNPEARPFVFYNAVVYHNLRIGVDANDKFRFYAGVDNLTNELPPYELAGNGSVANGDAIYPDTGRFVYAGFEAKF